nr:metal ABC transporter substrate-binding protein [Phycisphaerales bacterium]
RTLQDRLGALDAQYRTAVDALPADRRTIVVAHDAYSWLAKRYGLETVAIKGLTAQEPAPADLARAIATVRDRKISTVFIEPQVSSKASHRVAEATGARVAMLDPLGNGDYFRMMTDNLAAIRAALTPESK